MTAEEKRVAEAARREKHWARWGPYLSERQWGTVREDYSADGNAWEYLTHAMSRSYAYRWGEDGLAGWSDNHQRLCFALALWNGKDPYLKERLYGLGNPDGNHGEDVKEYYWYLDATPTHAYMKYRYRYPRHAFPYNELLTLNQTRGLDEPEYELLDTGALARNDFFDVTVEYAKADFDDIYIRIAACHHGKRNAPLHLIPSLWFRNDWSWTPGAVRPSLDRISDRTVRAEHRTLGTLHFLASETPRFLFTENDTNYDRLYHVPNPSPFVKDGLHRFLIDGETRAVREDRGTKLGAHYRLDLTPGEPRVLYFRLTEHPESGPLDIEQAAKLFETRIREADAFHAALVPSGLPVQQQQIARQAVAGMIWSRQYYYYVVEDWLRGDPGQPEPPAQRRSGRNQDWGHVYSDDILAMPDTWEYPWFAVWDSAFHAVTFALFDLEFAKRQITRFTREWYMHPNGQLPAYEWSFSDVNPPVHAWAAYRVYTMEKSRSGVADTDFLEAVFHKLLMNFTWWVNRKDAEGSNLFEGGFLGMDNIGVFDRSHPPPTSGRLEQSDGTSWMAMYCLNLLSMAWELSSHFMVYEDIASKFLEHFLYIAHAMNHLGDGRSLWHEEDGFFYDQLRMPDGNHVPLQIRSMVGLIPLLAVEILDYEKINDLPGFRRRMDWFYENRPDLTANIFCVFEPGKKRRCLLSLVNPDQLEQILSRMLDENEFLSDHGIRSLSKYHADHPYVFEIDGNRSEVRYQPGESDSFMFGGNSNWRGPVWFPVNFLIIETLRKLHGFWGDRFTVECPTGSGVSMNLGQVADEIRKRLISIFEAGPDGRPVFRGKGPFENDPLWNEDLHFYEYFHGDTGSGLGASHQTGWTGLIANLLGEAYP